MKKWMQKTGAFALAVTLLCGCVVGASAAGDTEENSVEIVYDRANCPIEFLDSTGAKINPDAEFNYKKCGQTGADHRKSCGG